MEPSHNKCPEELTGAVGEFLFVLQFLLKEWGENDIMILIPEQWKTTMFHVGIPIYFATDNTITVVVDCSDHYIQYHMPASALLDSVTKC